MIFSQENMTSPEIIPCEYLLNPPSTQAIEDLTGAVATEILLKDIFDKDYFWNERLLKVNINFLVTCLVMEPNIPMNGLVNQHAYSVQRAVEIEGHKLVLVRNPWGEFEWEGPWSKSRVLLHLRLLLIDFR